MNLFNGLVFRFVRPRICEFICFNKVIKKSTVSQQIGEFKSLPCVEKSFATISRYDSATAGSTEENLTSSKNKFHSTKLDGASPSDKLEYARKTVRNAGASQDSNSEYAQRRFALESRLKRPWTAGDVYTPHDLLPSEMNKWRTPRRMDSSPHIATNFYGKSNFDVFDVLNINPLHEYKNFALLSEFVTETGRIKPAYQTGLRRRNQRRVAKAIRRAIALGLIPSVYKHPKLLSTDPNWR